MRRASKVCRCTICGAVASMRFSMRPFSDHRPALTAMARHAGAQQCMRCAGCDTRTDGGRWKYYRRRRVRIRAGPPPRNRSRDAGASRAAERVATSISHRRLKRGIGHGDHHDIKRTFGCGSDLHDRGSGLQQDRTDRNTAGTRARHCRDSSTGRKRGYYSARVDNCIHHSLRRGPARPKPKLS